jgi:outer membrane protein TolC
VVAVEVMRRHLEVQRTTEAMSVAEQHLAEAEEAFRVVRSQFIEGQALPSQVLESEQVLRAAQARTTRASGDHAVAHAALLSVLGRVD